MTTATSPLLVEIADGIATLTLNRPDRMNALSPELIDTGIDALERCAVDSAVGCVVVTGAGKGFCAGGDITAMRAREGTETSFEQEIERQRAIHRLSLLLHSIPKITIAAVNGAAAGAGLGIMLACDLRIASDRARLITAFVKVGFSGDFGITWPLTRILGEARAKELMLLSEAVSAADAHALGLVNKVVPHDELMSAATALASRIAHGPLVAYRHIKENVRLASTEDYASLLDREAVTQRRCAHTADHREGVAAFLEKREPRFQGR